jgi:hypothetical protein
VLALDGEQGEPEVEVRFGTVDERPSGTDRVGARTFVSAQWLGFRFSRMLTTIQAEDGAVVGQSQLRLDDGSGTRLVVWTPQGETIFSVDQHGMATQPDCYYRVVTADDTGIGYVREHWIANRSNKPVAFLRRGKQRFTMFATCDYEIADGEDTRLAIIHNAGTLAPGIELLAPVDTAFRALTVAAAYGLWRRVEEAARP